jgi:tetrahydromethanopterin S-methyltransferase subunit F
VKAELGEEKKEKGILCSLKPSNSAMIIVVEDPIKLQ